MKFRKKPVVVEAVQVIGQSIEDLPEWAKNYAASFGYWVIRNEYGVYTLNPDIFAATYEKVGE